MSDTEEQEPVRIVDNRGRRGATPSAVILDEIDAFTDPETAAQAAAHELEQVVAAREQLEREQAAAARDAELRRIDHGRRERLARLRYDLDAARASELVVDDIRVDDLAFLLDEVARLRAGASLRRKADDSWPTVGQWIQHFIQAEQATREAMVGRCLQDSYELQAIMVEAERQAEQIQQRQAAARVARLFGQGGGLLVPDHG